MNRSTLSHSALADAEAVQRTHEWGVQEARLKPSSSALDLPRTTYHERRKELYQNLPFVAVAGWGTRTHDVVHDIAFKQYMDGRSFVDEAAVPTTAAQAELSPDLRSAIDLVTRDRSNGWRRLASRDDDEALFSAALVPRSKEEAAFYFECQIAEDELRTDIVTTAMMIAAFACGLSAFVAGYNVSVVNAPAAEVLFFPLKYDGGGGGNMSHHTMTPNAGGVMSMGNFEPFFSWTAAVAAFAAGGALGSLIATTTTNVGGRRRTLTASAFLALVAGAGLAGAPTVPFFIVARFLCGVAAGAASIVVPIYLGEVAPPVLRGTFGTGILLAGTFGLAAAPALAIVVVGWSWKWLVVVVGGPAVALVQLGCCAPRLLESPRWLIDRDDGSAEARDALRRLYGFRDPDLVELEVTHVIRANNVHKVHPAARTSLASHTLAAWRDLVDDPATRPVVVACCALAVFQQLSGINAVFAYSTTVLFAGGTVADPVVCTAAVAACHLVATYAAVLLMDHYGRRTLLLVSTTGMCLSALALGAALAVPSAFAGFFEATASFDLVPRGLATVVALASYVTFYALGLGPVPPLLVAEMFEPRHIHTALSITILLQWLAHFLAAALFPAQEALLGPALLLPNALFGPLAAFVFTLKALPETRSKSVRTIQREMIMPHGARPTSSSLYDAVVNNNNDNATGNSARTTTTARNPRRPSLHRTRENPCMTKAFAKRTTTTTTDDDHDVHTNTSRAGPTEATPLR